MVTALSLRYAFYMRYDPFCSGTITTGIAHSAVAVSMMFVLHIRLTSSATNYLVFGPVRYSRWMTGRASGLKLMQWELKLISPRCPSHILSNFGRMYLRRSKFLLRSPFKSRCATVGVFSFYQESYCVSITSGQISADKSSTVSPSSCTGMILVGWVVIVANLWFLTNFCSSFPVFSFRIRNGTFGLTRTTPLAATADVLS